MDLALRRRCLNPDVRQALVELARGILSRDRDVAAAWLLGSVARAEPARDVDLAVLPRAGADPWTVADRIAVALERELRLGLPVDVRPVTAQAPPAFRYEVVREGILLADEDPDARVLFWADAVRDYLDIAPLLARSRRAFLEGLARGA